MKLLKIALTAVATLGALPASATLIQIGNITPAFVNALPGGSTTINNAGDPITARWGIPDTSAGQSGYNFDDAATPFMVDTSILGGRFLLGTFTHLNNPVFEPVLSSIGLSLSVAITGGSPSTFSETFTLFHNETPNTTGGPADNDIVTFSAGTTNSFFTLSGQNFSLRLFGFSTDGGVTLLPQFSSAEGGTNSAQLWAQIVAVPEPTTLLLLGVGLLSLAATRRRRA